MTTIKKDDYIFSVNVEQTKKYYETHSLCNCGNCRNFYTQAKDKFPKIGELLSEFGVDISKPDEIESVDMEEAVMYINIDFTVCGSVEAMGQREIEVYDHMPLHLVVTEGYTCPNEQTGEYFTISVTGVAMPWVLDEPFPGTGSLKIKNWLRKGFQKQ